MPINVSLVEIELKSPTLLVERVGRTGFSSIVGWIPGSALRGSIITWSVRMGYLTEDTYQREMNSPTLLVHPAYPVSDGSVARPPTPYILRCKMENEIIDALGRDKIRDITQANDLKALSESLKEPSFLCRESRGIPNSTKMENYPIIPKRGKIRRYSPPGGEYVDVLTSVAINKTLRSAEREMLFNYEVLLPKQRFRTLIVDRSGNGAFINYLRSEEPLFIGRGVSRGLGRAEARVLKTWEFESLVKELGRRAIGWIIESNSRVRVALYSRSMAARILGWGISSYLPKQDAKWLNIDTSLGLAIGRDNRVLAIGRKTIFLSVSYPKGLPRPNLSCSDKGSIFIMESESSREVVSRELALGSILGWDSLAVLGLNFLQPLGWWYDDPVYS